MNLRCNILIAIMTVFAFTTMNAKIVTWTIHPNYEKLVRYNGDLFLFQQGGKWGIVKEGDIVVLPANYDYITSPVDGYALFASREGSKIRLEGILGVDGKVNLISERYYLSISRQHDYAFFSENKLVVYNPKGKFGYIDPAGNTIIKCQFDDALPFKEGWAPVLQGNYMRYINDRYEQSNNNVLSVDFHYGDMTDASCFSNGQAVIAYNDDYALINKNGEKIKKIKEVEFNQLYQKHNSPLNTSDKRFDESSRYNIISENGKYGLEDKGTIIAEPQFDSFSTQYNDGILVAVSNGKYGVLKVSEGEISITTSIQGKSSNELEVDRKGHLTPVTVDYTIPSYIQNPKVLVDLGDGTYRDFTSQGTGNGLNQSLSMTPVIEKNSESCRIKVAIEHDGILLAGIEKTFAVSYPIKLRVSSPGPSTIRANENYTATFSSTIFNDSNKQVTVTATWSSGGKPVTITIPAHGNKTVSGSIQVESKFRRTIRLALSSGEKNEADILFEPYF